METTKQPNPALAGIDGTTFDAVIIGGGINGVAVARDAALRGLRVCLFEQGDFASGTSSKSTKIAHGGLRYLRNFEFGLVREAQRERLLMRRLLPHLVSPQSFVYPVYADGGDPLWKVRLGLTVYDRLAGTGSKERHIVLPPAEATTANPMLRTSGLTGALRYWDDRMDDARVVLETALSAQATGATCLNYVRVTEARRRPNASFEVGFQDVMSDETGSVAARAVVNCAGPWFDSVMTNVLRAPSRQLAPTKGVHLVVPRIEGQDALILENQRDRRTFFAIPWDDTTLIGTTDTRYEGDPADVKVEQADVDYLIDAASHNLPNAGLKASDVIYSFAGLRPLVSPGNDNVAEGKISRRHRVAIEPEGVVTLVGGKFTTYRQMAEEATDAIFDVLGEPKRASTTTTALHFPTIDPRMDRLADLPLWARLTSRYGPRAGTVFDLCFQGPGLRDQVLPGYDLVWGELVFSITQERARSLDDLIERRTRLAWRKELTPEKRIEIGARLDAIVPGWRIPQQPG